MVGGRAWTGFEAAALQEAMRQSVREFAALLGVETTTVANWRSGLGRVSPRSHTQAILDTTYEQRATPEDRARFAQIVDEGERAWRGRHSAGRRGQVVNGSVIDGIAEPTSGGAFEEIRRRAVVDADELASSARVSLEFAHWVTHSSPDKVSIDSLHTDLARIATTYVHQPLSPLLFELNERRDQARALLAGTRPARARDLLMLGGVAMTMLAHVCDDLGDPFAAMQHTFAAERLAHQAGHTALEAWIAGTQALIAEWSGRHGKAMEFVGRGAHAASSRQQRVRLAALEARASARAGRADHTRGALRRVERFLDEPAGRDDLDEFGGILSFPAPKAMYYVGSARILIELGEHAALAAIKAYESGPVRERSYGDEALARCDVAIARIARRDMEGAVDVLAVVLELPAAKRIQSIRDGLARVRRHLSSTGHTGASGGRELHEKIDAFSSNACEALPS